MTTARASLKRSFTIMNNELRIPSDGSAFDPIIVEPIENDAAKVEEVPEALKDILGDGEVSNYNHRRRMWFVTDFNAEPLPFNRDNMAYMCRAKEHCPETDRLHYHYVFAFIHARSFSSMKGEYRQANIQPMKGRIDQAIQYLKGPWSQASTGKHKPANETFEEFGMSADLFHVDADSFAWWSRVFDSIRYGHGSLVERYFSEVDASDMYDSPAHVADLDW